MSYGGSYGSGGAGAAVTSLRADVLRVAWKPTATPPQYQVADTDSVPKVVVYTDETQPSEFIASNVALGEFEVVKEVTTAEFLINAQIARDSGGGTDEWGLFFETWDGNSWVVVDDSTRYFTFIGSSDDDIKHISYSVATNALPVGTRFRVMQICSDVSDNIGIIASKPFANAPLSAGIVVSVKVTGYP